ncbi:hypothetical protein AB0D30_39430 [Streptomyces sp. NPDC048409]|uniref:hypothetical protein n=1 Tax=Streptomyces sp. NPDC048409 TaxID=3154723 RepID=UPI00344A6251
MARHPQPRRITLGGHEAVALTVREYEQLMAGRRQIGGQSARVRVLAQQLKRTEQLLGELGNMVGGAADRHPQDAECLRCAIADLLRRHRAPGAPRLV